MSKKNQDHNSLPTSSVNSHKSKSSVSPGAAQRQLEDCVNLALNRHLDSSMKLEGDSEKEFQVPLLSSEEFQQLLQSKQSNRTDSSDKQLNIQSNESGGLDYVNQISIGILDGIDQDFSRYRRKLNQDSEFKSYWLEFNPLNDQATLQIVLSLFLDQLFHGSERSNLESFLTTLKGMDPNSLKKAAKRLQSISIEKQDQAD